MAKVKPSLVQYSGTVDRVIHYTRFGRTYSRRLPAEFNDRKSEAQLRQRALFRSRQKVAALFGIILQRGLTKVAHEEGMTEANFFSRLNKCCFVYEDGGVRVDYRALQVASGPLPEVSFLTPVVDGLHVEVAFDPRLDLYNARPDDVVHLYAVEPLVEVCMPMVSVCRQDGRASFVLPDLSEECNGLPVFYLYAIVESASTATIPTLSAAEKQLYKQHRNINRRVSRSLFAGTVSPTA